MADTRTLHSLHAALDPKSLILSQFSYAIDKPHSLKLTTTGSFVMERGPRYNEYSDLRDRKLRTKNLREQQTPEDTQKPQTRSSSKILTPPPKKQVKFNAANFTTPPRRPRGILTQSVPDFSSALRKENRKPSSAAAGPPPVAERSALTPPPSKSGSRMAYGKVGGGTGSKSADSGDKRSCGGGLIVRKSYASVEELKGLAAAAGSAINGESRGGGLRSGKGIGRNSVLGLRQF